MKKPVDKRDKKLMDEIRQSLDEVLHIDVSENSQRLDELKRRYDVIADDIEEMKKFSED